MESKITIRSSCTSRSRANFAARHMQAAEHFAAQVAQIEQSARGAVEESFAAAEYYHYWNAAIVFSVMSLEANIYDIMRANERGEMSPLLGRVVPDAHRGPTLDRYEIVWNLLSPCKFKKGEGSAQGVACLIELRDEIVHAKTEHRDDAQISIRLERRLRRRFKPNPFKTGDVFFPDRCVSADSAKWATTTASTFMREFAAETGLRLNAW